MSIQGHNPYGRPIAQVFDQLRNLEWKIPFVTDVIVLCVSCIVLVILAILYVTVGVVAHVSSIFTSLIEQAREDMQGKPTIEKTGYIVAIGVYFAFLAPLWLIQLPFLIVGWIWEIFGYFSLIVLAVLLLIYWVVRSPLIEVPFLERFVEQYWSSVF